MSLGSLRRAAVAWLASLALVGCAGGQKVAPAAPAVVPAPEQIPVDLDVVARLDMRRLRGAVGVEAADSLGRLVCSMARRPEPFLVSAVAASETIWLGIRPDPNPAWWDNVIVFEGDFSRIPTSEITDLFGPSRDLGAGFKVYDGAEVGVRSAPARLYTQNESRLIVASEAEVDALERVIERHRSERDTVPPARGLMSVHAKLRGAPLSVDQNRALRALEQAVSFEGSLDVIDSQVVANARVSFVDAEDARLAERAAHALVLVLEGRWGKWHVEALAADLTVRLKMPLSLAVALSTG